MIISFGSEFHSFGAVAENDLLKKEVLMFTFYSLIMVFPGYLLFHVIVGKLFSLQNFALSLSKWAAKILKIG